LIVANIMAALDLPANSLVNQRIPKTMLIKNSAPTAADKKRINADIEEIKWLAALKPSTSAVPEYRDSLREYLEIAVISVYLRNPTKIDRLSELVHRTIPYPVFLILVLELNITLSLAHIRWSQAKSEETVIDNEIVSTSFNTEKNNDLYRTFLNAISFMLQPRNNMFSLYQGWIDTLIAMKVAQLTGTFTKSLTTEHAKARQAALNQCTKLEAEMNRIRTIAKKEKQIARQVELNMQLKQLEGQLKTARELL